ncbi:serine/threonine protein kinase [Bifidobacterium goeldii]|uniref:non-specific serine/threonine protein kinase n=2 Tax=Bifidobacterium goeldii TaxID=2306975 RepID=A0A430FH43_9BIFI|nr:serine/threonine-protein kinase [Bifidobacterium goeldii]RSX52166.1 serine/threonine protein kinase [Bifidobacterium goeldii]
MSSALELKPGDLVGGYTLVSRLGSGAMGSVWRVRDDGGTVYAMKILRDSLADDRASAAASADQLTARERLRREAMALKKVNHPGVCSIVDMELDDSLAFIVTELIEGKNLRDDVAINGRYVGDDLERLASKLMDAVRAVHAAGIVHRDIKPTNVMVSASGPVLVDFGIAMGEGESHVTRTGLVMGTPGFIAPEIIEGSESDETTDWWSVSSVLAFAATGKPVFGTKPMMAVLEREASGNANLSGLPAQTMAAFRSALDPDRRKRCTPEQLLHTITVDALNPIAWQQAAATVAADGSDVMRPFDGPDLRNPRTLWRDDTQVIAQTAQTSHTADGVPSLDSTAAMPNARPALQRIISQSVPPLPPNTPPQPPTESLDVASTMPFNSAATAPLSVDPPTIPVNAASGEPIASENIPRTAAYPQEPAATQPLQPVPPAPGEATEVIADIPPQFVPPANATPADGTMAAAAPSAAAAPLSPTDAKRSAYLQRGRVFTAMLALPIAAMAMSMPLIATVIAGVLFWLLLTIGFSVNAQLQREDKHGGERRGGDTALRVVTLPWHAVKAILPAISRDLIMLGVLLVSATLLTLILALPTVNIQFELLGIAVVLPIIAAAPLSMSGCALAACAAAGWLTAVFSGTSSSLLRIGAGSLLGIRDLITPPVPNAPVPVDDNASAIKTALRHPSARELALWIALAVVTVAGIVVAGMGGGIEWWPLPTTVTV